MRGARVRDVSTGYLVDGQNNGAYLDGRAIDFTAPGLRQEQVEAFYAQSFARGIFPCPTLITPKELQFEAWLNNLAVIASAMRNLKIDVPSIHCEGPFFDGRDGAIGAHPADGVLEPTIERLDSMIAASEGMLRTITVSANVANIAPLIAYAVSKGLLVSLGHHVPTKAQFDAAVEAGAGMITHDGNASPAMVARRGFHFFQLASGLPSGFIPDGSHLEDYYMQLILRLKTFRGAVPVSDRSPLGGAPCTPDGQWLDLWGSGIQIVPNRNSFMIVGRNEKLAGSWEDLLGCANYLGPKVIEWDNAGQLNGWREPCCSQHHALWEMIAINPVRHFLGIDIGRFNLLAEKLGIRKVQMEKGVFSLAA